MHNLFIPIPAIKPTVVRKCANEHMVLPIVIEYRGGTPTGNAVRFVAILYWSRIQVKDLAVVARPRGITFALPSSTWANT
jgi:hypothetical protein